MKIKDKYFDTIKIWGHLYILCEFLNENENVLMDYN